MGINLYELFANKYIDPVVENYCKNLNMSSQDLKASMVELLDRFPLEAQGCQFALTFPDLLQMQVRAILCKGLLLCECSTCYLHFTLIHKVFCIFIIST